MKHKQTMVKDLKSKLVPIRNKAKFTVEQATQAGFEIYTLHEDGIIRNKPFVSSKVVLRLFKKPESNLGFLVTNGKDNVMSLSEPHSDIRFSCLLKNPQFVSIDIVRDKLEVFSSRLRPNHMESLEQYIEKVQKVVEIHKDLLRLVYRGIVIYKLRKYRRLAELFKPMYNLLALVGIHPTLDVHPYLKRVDLSNTNPSKLMFGFHVDDLIEEMDWGLDWQDLTWGDPNYTRWSESSIETLFSLYPKLIQRYKTIQGV